VHEQICTICAELYGFYFFFLGVLSSCRQMTINR